MDEFQNTCLKKSEEVLAVLGLNCTTKYFFISNPYKWRQIGPKE
jgi:hypothetical protein